MWLPGWRGVASASWRVHSPHSFGGHGAQDAPAAQKRSSACRESRTYRRPCHRPLAAPRAATSVWSLRPRRARTSGATSSAAHPAAAAAPAAPPRPRRRPAARRSRARGRPPHARCSAATRGGARVSEALVRHGQESAPARAHLRPTTAEPGRQRGGSAYTRRGAAPLSESSSGPYSRSVLAGVCSSTIGPSLRVRCTLTTGSSSPSTPSGSAAPPSAAAASRAEAA
eukprot:2920957-Prymnesium_polylepis.1